MAERGNSLLRHLDQCLGIPLTAPCAIYRALARPKTGPNNRIGIFCPGAIGDALLLSALAKGIRAQLPEAWIELIGTEENYPVFPLIPCINASFHAPIKRPDLLISHMRQQKFDILFDASQWARIGAIITAFSRARVTVGFRTKGQFRSLPYDLKVNHRADVHETENFLALGKKIWPGLDAAPSLALPEWKKDSRQPIYCHLWPARGKNRILKEWPENCWQELIGGLLAKGHKVALTGSSADAEANGRFIAAHFAANPNIASLAGQCPLPELGRKFAKAKAVISVNTGIMHLAALAGAPTVGLHGATNPKRWGPVGKRAMALLPQSGQYAYLNLGFEYPPNAQPAMQCLRPATVMRALGKLGVFSD